MLAPPPWNPFAACSADHLPWEGTRQPPAGVAEQLLSLSEALRQLVPLLLQQRSSALSSSSVSASSSRSSSIAPAAPGSPEAGQRVGDLCALLWQLLQTEPLRQGTLVCLAASADLVPRLWFSHLKVRAAYACACACACVHVQHRCTCPSSSLPFPYTASLFRAPSEDTQIIPCVAQNHMHMHSFCTRTHMHTHRAPAACHIQRICVLVIRNCKTAMSGRCSCNRHEATHAD